MRGCPARRRQSQLFPISIKQQKKGNDDGSAGSRGGIVTPRAETRQGLREERSDD